MLLGAGRCWELVAGRCLSLLLVELMLVGAGSWLCWELVAAELLRRRLLMVLVVVAVGVV